MQNLLIKTVRTLNLAFDVNFDPNIEIQVRKVKSKH